MQKCITVGRLRLFHLTFVEVVKEKALATHICFFAILGTSLICEITNLNTYANNFLHRMGVKITIWSGWSQYFDTFVLTMSHVFFYLPNKRMENSRLKMSMCFASCRFFWLLFFDVSWYLFVPYFFSYSYVMSM